VPTLEILQILLNVCGLVSQPTITRRLRFRHFCELDNDLYIVIRPPVSASEVPWLFSSGDQPGQPGTACPRQRFASLIPVPFVGVDAANDDVVLQLRHSCLLQLNVTYIAAMGRHAWVIPRLKTASDKLIFPRRLSIASYYRPAYELMYFFS